MRDQSLQFTKPTIKLTTKLVLLVIASISLMFLDNRVNIFDQAKSKVMVLAYPIQYAASRPMAWFNDARHWFSGHDELIKEVDRLARENFLLKSELSRKMVLQNEINELKSLLFLTKENVEFVTTAEVVSVGPEPFLTTMLLDKGHDDGVRVGQAVVNGQGFVGQITQVQPHSSRVGLLQSQQMTIPVMIARTGVRTLIYGEQNKLSLKYFPSTQDLEDGDVLVTSGMNDRFPSGIPIAKVRNVRRDSGTPYYVTDLETLVTNNRLRYVLVMPLKKPLLDFEEVARESAMVKERMEKREQAEIERREAEAAKEESEAAKLEAQKALAKAQAQEKKKAGKKNRGKSAAGKRDGNAAAPGTGD